MTVLGGNCPTGCGRKVRSGQLMCLSCWVKVPADLQKRVYAAWRAWRKDFSNAEAMEALAAAKEAAIASIA